MRTILPRRGRSSALLALAMILGVPALAEAQLFPNLPLRKRERADCSQENPQYKMVRQEYWGYYPTCWRKFPAGWGCPSADAPNWEQAKRDLALDKLPDDGLPPAEGDGMPADGADPAETPANPPANNALPELPSEGTSPFDQPVTPPTPPPATPGTAPGVPPAGAAPPGTAARPRRARNLVSGLFNTRKR